MSSPNSTTVPLLPCEAFDATLDFWQALGYEVTYKQRAPNPYAAMQYDDYEIHFFGLKQLDPQANFSACLVIVPEVEGLHATFAGRLKEALGRVPARGFPHITRMRPGQTRFTVVDNAGNSVMFIKRGPEDEEAAQEYKKEGLTPLQRAVSLAARLRDYKHDDAAAAKVLDVALARPHQEAPLDVARALTARIELAAAMEEPERARDLHAQFRNLSLSEAERGLFAHELAALDALERSLATGGSLEGNAP